MLGWGPALRHRGYRVLFLSLLPGTLGLMMAMVAFGYVAYRISGSATLLALTTAGYGISMALLSPVAGMAADRFSRRTLLLVTQGTLGVSAAIAALLIATGAVQTWQLLLVSMLQGAAFAVNMPARQALIAELVPAEDLANAIALSNAGLNLNRILGPALAGVLLSIPAVGPVGVFLLMALLYAVVFVALLRLPKPVRVGRAPRMGRGSALVGMRYVFENPALRRLMAMAALPVLFGMPYQSLMPATADRVFGVGAAGLGTLLAANGVGALGGSLLVAARTGSRSGAAERQNGIERLRRLQLTAGVVLGGAVVAFGLNGQFLLALPLVALAGGASAAYSSVNSTLLMQGAEREYHGRVMSVYMMAFSAMPLSSVPAAWVADHVGLPLTLTVCGLTCATIVALLGRVALPEAAPAPPPVPCAPHGRRRDRHQAEGARGANAGASRGTGPPPAARGRAGATGSVARGGSDHHAAQGAVYPARVRAPEPGALAEQPGMSLASASALVERLVRLALVERGEDRAIARLREGPERMSPRGLAALEPALIDAETASWNLDDAREVFTLPRALASSQGAVETGPGIRFVAPSVHKPRVREPPAAPHEFRSRDGDCAVGSPTAIQLGSRTHCCAPAWTPLGRCVLTESSCAGPRSPRDAVQAGLDFVSRRMANATDAAHVAVIACPVCHRRHVVRANVPPVRVDCGALAAVVANRRVAEARVWPAAEERTDGRLAALIGLIDV